MFEWPNATPVDLQSYARRHWYEHFCQFEIPLTYRTVQIDITDLKAYCKSNNVNEVLNQEAATRQVQGL